MNINELKPNTMNVATELEKATKYAGTFSELLELVNTDKVVLTTTITGEVNGFWIKTGLDTLQDALAGMNFATAYTDKPVEEWIEIIYKTKSAGKTITSVNEDLGVMVIDGKIVEIPAVHYYDEEEDDYDDDYEDDEWYDDEEEDSEEEEDDPSVMHLDVEEDLDGDDSLTNIKNYIRRTTRHCLARGCELDIAYEGDNVIRVSNIELGRALSNAELERL